MILILIHSFSPITIKVCIEYFKDEYEFLCTLFFSCICIASHVCYILKTIYFQSGHGYFHKPVSQPSLHLWTSNLLWADMGMWHVQLYGPHHATVPGHSTIPFINYCMMMIQSPGFSSIATKFGVQNLWKMRNVIQFYLLCFYSFGKEDTGTYNIWWGL